MMLEKERKDMGWRNIVITEQCPYNHGLSIECNGCDYFDDDPEPRCKAIDFPEECDPIEE